MTWDWAHDCAELRLGLRTRGQPSILTSSACCSVNHPGRINLLEPRRRFGCIPAGPSGFVRGEHTVEQASDITRPSVPPWRAADRTIGEAAGDTNKFDVY